MYCILSMVSCSRKKFESNPNMRQTNMILNTHETNKHELPLRTQLPLMSLIMRLTNKHETNIPEFHYMILLHGQILPLGRSPAVSKGRLFISTPSSCPKIPGEGGSLTILPNRKESSSNPTTIFQGLYMLNFGGRSKSKLPGGKLSKLAYVLVLFFLLFCNLAPKSLWSL